MVLRISTGLGSRVLCSRSGSVSACLCDPEWGISQSAYSPICKMRGRLRDELQPPLMLLSYDSVDILLGSSRVETWVIHILYPLDMLPPTEGGAPCQRDNWLPFNILNYAKRCKCFLSLYLQWFSYCSNPTEEKKCTSMHKGHWNQHNKINKKIWAIECDRHKGQIPGLLQPTFCVTASPNLSFLICTTGMILPTFTEWWGMEEPHM